MRTGLSLAATLILIGLIVVVLRSSPTPDTNLGSAPSSTTTLPATTDTSLAPIPTTTTLLRPVTDTTIGATDETGLTATFVLSEVVFGENGYIVVTNVGGATGNLGGFALCQRPAYYQFDSIDVEPFASVWVAMDDGSSLTNASVTIVGSNGALGRLNPGSGEMALYRSSEFSSSAEILSYVEWGVSGHGRSSVAIEAGLWEADAFIEIPDDAFGVVSTTDQPDAPEDWVAQIGG